jgi:flagellar motor switch protein FliN
MSEILSKEQIDQLLAAGGFSDEGQASGGAASGGDYEALKKPFGTFCTQMASVLKTVLNRAVTAQVVSCSKADAGELKATLVGGELCVALPFRTGLTGDAYLFITKKDAAILGDLMMMGEGTADYAPEHNDALAELSNQILSSFALALTSERGVQISAGPAKLTEYTLDALPPAESPAMVVVAFTVDGKPESRLALYIAGGLAAQMAGGDAAPPAEPAVAPGGAAAFSVTDFGGATDGGGYHAAAPAPRARAPQPENIEMLLDIDLDVSIELGSSNLSIKRILELAPGSIVELDRMAGEPVDLMVNSKVVAKGEVVVIDESFGIRILSLISPEERIKSLR